jgi:DNA-binding NarL/FixJ family response regulator
MLKIRFLIAESSKGLQSYVRQLFEDFSFDTELIRAAETPQAALEVARELKPDFLLTDWFAKEAMSGIDLFKEVKAFNPACQLGLLSTDVGPERVHEAQEAGAVFLQLKPCSAADLRTALGKAIQTLSTKNPQVDSHVDAVALAAARHLAALKAASQLNQFTVGDPVLHRGRRDTVKHVILSRGQMMLRLHSVHELIPATDVQRP